MSLYEKMINSGHTVFRYRSYLPLMIIPPLFVAMNESANVEEIIGGALEDTWVLLCFMLSLFGLGIRAHTIGHVPGGTSGRNTQSQRAHHLNTTGLYSIVRNPLYLGNYIIILGVLMSTMVWWLVLLGSFAFFIYMERIILTEEKFLTDTYGKEYTEWCKKTPVILPKFSLWQKPELSFSWKTVCKREYPGFIAIGSAFFIIEFITDVFFEREALSYWLAEDFIWPVTFALMLVIGLTFRYLKKHTSYLKVEGR